MALKTSQSGSLGANVSTGSSHLSSPSTGRASPASPKLVTNNSQPQLGSGVTPTGVPSTPARTTLGATMEAALDGDKIVGGMDNLNNRPGAFENVATEMQTNVDQTLEIVGTSETGKALQIAGTGITTAGSIIGVALSETAIGAVVGAAIAVVGAGVGGIGTMMENDAKNFANDAEGLLNDQVDDFVKVAQNHKEQGNVIDLALQPVATEQSAVA